MMKFEHEEGLPGGPNEVKVSGFFDNQMFNLNTGYSKKGDNLSFSSGANFNANLNDKRFNTDINAMLKANLLKGLTGSVGGNLNVNERGESVFSPNLDLKYHSNNLDAKVGYSGDKKIKAGLSGHKDFKNGLSIQGSLDSGYDLDKNKFIAPQVNAGLTYNFQAGGNAMYLNDDEIANYKAGGYTVIEEFEEGGDNGEDELITYKNNKSKVDGTADWNWSSDVDISSAYNDQIKARLLTGNYGYNPKTGELVKLDKSQQTKVTDKEALDTKKTLKETAGMSSKEYEIFQDNEKEAARQRLMDDYTSNRKLVSIDKADEWNPSFTIQNESGQDINTQDYAGKQVYMTPAQEAAYKKAVINQNIPATTQKMNNAFRAAASVTPVGMAINAMEGATRLGMDVPELIKDPSLSTAGAVGMDLLMASPFIPAAARKTGQVISKVDDALMNAPRAQMTLNSGVNPSMMVNAYQDTRAAIDKIKGIKFPFSKTGQQLDQIKGSGAYWDEVGIPGKDLVSKSEMVEYVGTKSGRPVVNVKMPDGTTQQFYKSVGDPAKGGAGKVGQGVGGTTEGMRQPFGGFADHPKATNWFIKDGGFKDFYGSKTYRDIAGELDNTLIKKFNAKNVDELDDFINFQNRNRPGDDFIPDFNHGGTNHPPQESAEGQRDWMMNYIQSPMYLKRLSKEFPDYSNEQLEAEKNARLSNVKNVNIKYPDKPLQDYFGNVSGEYFPKKQKPDSFNRNIGTGKLTKPNYPSNKKGNMYLEPEYRQDNWNPDEGFNTIPLHELGHAADDGGYRIPYKTEKLIYDSTNKAYEGLGAKYDVPVESYAQSVVSDMPFYYKNNPTEFVNRLTPLRYELERAGIWKPGEEDFIDGMYNIMLKNPDVMKNEHVQDVLDQIPGADDSRSKRATVTKLLNEIALNDVEQDLNVAKHGGSHNEGYSSTNDGDTYTEVISNRPNDSYEYQRKKDLKSGNLSYFQRKKGTDTWNTAGAEGTRGFRAITDVFGEDKTGYATSQDKRDFRNELLTARAQKEANEKATEEEQPVDKVAEMTAYYKANAPWMSDEQIKTAVNKETGQASKNLQSDAEALYGKKQPVFGGPSSGNTVVAGGSDFYERDKYASNIGIGDGKTAKEAATEFVEAVPGMLAEGSGFNAGKRLYNKGAKQVVGDLANTAADIVGGAGEAIYEAGDYLVGDGSFDMSGTNWMTGNEYGSGLGTVLDVASILPAAGVLGKVAKSSKYLKPIINPIKTNVSNLSTLGKKGLNWATNKAGSVEIPGINHNWTGGNSITVGDVANYANSGLKYNPFKAAGVNTGLTNTYGTGWGGLTVLGIDNTVRGDNSFSDIASGNFDLNKSALGRYGINAADDLSLINDSRKSQATKNTINEGYTFGDAAKIGINLSPMKFLSKSLKPVGESLKAEAQLALAPKYIAKAFKKGSDKVGAYAHEDIENNTPVNTAGIKQDGGTSNYSEQYLTDAEIEALIAQGYTVEDFS